MVALWLSALATQVAALPVSISTKDLGDLSFLKAELQGKQLVELGEATHGGAEFYRLKTRIMRYLHESLGYDTLILESGVLETTLAMEQRNGMSSDSLMDSTVFANFRWQESRPLFDYLKAHPKLRVIGIDPQFSSDAVLDLTAVLIRPYDVEFAKEVNQRLGGGYQYMGLTNKPEEFGKARDSYVAWLNDSVKRLGKIKPKLQDISRFQLVTTAFKDLSEYWNYKPDSSPTERFMLRDRIMARNVTRLLGKDKGILWAHNGHIGKGLGYKVMGDFVRDALGQKAYALGIFAQKGSYYAHWQNSTASWSTDAAGFESQFPTTGEAWFTQSSRFSAPVKAWEPENGGLITFVPSKRFDGVLVVTSLNPPTKRQP